MIDDAYPEHPKAYASDDEREIDCADLFNEWRCKLEERIKKQVQRLGWRYVVGATSLSRTANFEIIFRAKVEYIVEGESHEYVELLWQDEQGLCGGLSAPIEALSHEPPQKFSFCGSSRFLLDEPDHEEIWVEVAIANDQET
ncbi:MAG: hypothetical protein NXH78_07835 [Hyphomonadaceae bacterium]|nr:hypothetical protein [Hyphomonadaceae bacterium]